VPSIDLALGFHKANNSQVLLVSLPRVPPIADAPAPNVQITFADGQVRIPE
jgi:hypothetical protein